MKTSFGPGPEDPPGVVVAGFMYALDDLLQLKEIKRIAKRAIPEKIVFLPLVMFFIVIYI
jgi:hypothetical protein